MGSTRDLNLSKYKISDNKYRELKYYCLQYQEWKKEISSSSDAVKSPDISGSHGGKIGDSTGSLAIKRVELKKKCETIEQAAAEANSFIAKWIIESVTTGIAYSYLNVPCGRRQFYEARKKFFFLLSYKKG